MKIKGASNSFKVTLRVPDHRPPCANPSPIRIIFVGEVFVFIMKEERRCLSLCLLPVVFRFLVFLVIYLLRYQGIIFSPLTSSVPKFLKVPTFAEPERSTQLALLTSNQRTRVGGVGVGGDGAKAGETTSCLVGLGQGHR